MQKRVVILGGGESGVGAALLASKLGYEVFLSDRGSIAPDYKRELETNNLAYEEGMHSEVLINNAHLVIKSPGIPSDVSLIKQIRSKGISIISEIEFASRYTNSKIIAITGTNGKTTSTLLTYHLLKEAGLDVEIAGNIGFSFARKLAEKDHDYFVLEVSSFQLDDIVSFAPQLAIILNITPDHLNRYDNNIDKYADAKLRIAEKQSADQFLLVFGEDRLITKGLGSKSIGSNIIKFGADESADLDIYESSDKLVFNLKERFELEKTDLTLIGKHNMLNTMAASSAASLVGIDRGVIKKALGTFKNAEHRLEFVTEIDGIRFINDSKATNVDAVYYAIEGVSSNIVWIAGGVDKGNDYYRLKPFVDSKKIKALVCLGKDNDVLFNAFAEDLMCKGYSAMEEAVEAAFQIAGKGDTVLLSPACASFDLFKNYEDRGEKFKAAVAGIKKKKTLRELV